MDDPDDKQFKVEIDKIMSNIAETMKRIEDLNLLKSDHSRQNQD